MAKATTPDWRKYVQFLAGSSYDPSLAIASPEFQVYDVRTSKGIQRVRSMLTHYEIALLYSAARDWYNGSGEIVDAGPLLGVGTRALAQGLADNPGVTRKDKRIWSFDLWLAAGLGHYTADRGQQTGSVFEDFLSVNEDFRNEIHSSPGDLMMMTWNPALPIEILFIDISKTLELNAWILRQWFPRLIPGRSLVLQQDYVYFAQWWVAATMEYFRDDFELLGHVFGATAYYLCRNRPSIEMINAFLGLGQQELMALLDRAIAGAPPSVAEVLRCGKAYALVPVDPAAAAATLAQVRLGVGHDDPVQNFSAITASNAEIVGNVLAAARSRFGT
jgi:hypothetical protein